MKLKTTKFISIFITLLFISVLSINSFGQTKTKKTHKSYNTKLAKKLGADDYGMRQYVFAILKTGPSKIQDKKRVQELQAGHMANIKRLAKEGKLVLAGPFMDGGENRGIYIFNVTTIEEAEELVKTDPAIKAGIFEFELTKWYGSAALMQVNQTHSKIQKTKIE